MTEQQIIALIREVQKEEQEEADNTLALLLAIKNIDNEEDKKKYVNLFLWRQMGIAKIIVLNKILWEIKRQQ